jgi:hypothetical protein
VKALMLTVIIEQQNTKQQHGRIYEYAMAAG